jgi:PadR family transcriptional regulator AphA
MKDRQLTTAAYITLGLLTSRDWSAYQLAEQVGRGVDQLWPRADRQRYITPKRLEEEGLVTARIEPSGKRTRTVYSITPAGRAELARWLTLESRQPMLEFEGMIRVLLAEQGSIEDLRATLEGMRRQSLAARQLFARHAKTLAETPGTFPERRHVMAMSNRFMIGHYDHIIEWATWAIEQTSAWPDAASPATSDDAQIRQMLAPGLAISPDTGSPDAATGA